MRPIFAVPLFVLACSAGTGVVVAAEAESVVEALKDCARNADPDMRFKCYDELGQKMLSNESKPAVVAPPVSAASEPTPVPVASRETPAPATQAPATTETVAKAAVPAAAVAESPGADAIDTIGGYQFEPKLSAEKEDEKQREEGLSTRVVKCQRSRENIWYFRLENGQVWKQTDRQSLSFQGCDFGAVVANDGIGYVLRIDGRKGKIRIRRLQ